MFERFWCLLVLVQLLIPTPLVFRVPRVSPGVTLLEWSVRKRRARPSSAGGKHTLNERERVGVGRETSFFKLMLSCFNDT